ncbi:MAG: hypothetical protein IKA61_06790 [Clostridia bacterium]|nr:hypothetical protein [Clostridia bacterium]
MAGYNSYKITAESQGKLHVKSALLANKSTFTFTVYVPSTSTAKLGGYGEFAIRVKSNDLEPNIDGRTDGHINYNSSSSIDELKLVYDQWATYTVDVSSLDSNCTEWAFVVAAGNVIYLRDVIA